MHIQLRIQKESFNKEMGFSPFFYIYNLTKKENANSDKGKIAFSFKNSVFPSFIHKLYRKILFIANNNKHIF